MSVDKSLKNDFVKKVESELELEKSARYPILVIRYKNDSRYIMSNNQGTRQNGGFGQLDKFISLLALKPKKFKTITNFILDDAVMFDFVYEVNPLDRF